MIRDLLAFLLVIAAFCFVAWDTFKELDRPVKMIDREAVARLHLKKEESS